MKGRCLVVGAAHRVSTHQSGRRTSGADAEAESQPQQRESLVELHDRREVGGAEGAATED